MTVSIEQLKERARDWLEPVSAAAPAGKPAKAEPEYESVLAEVAKLESVTGGEVDWSAITSLSGRILKRSSKDLRIATYLAYGLYVTQGLDGLSTGLVVLSETMDRYWPTLFPELNRLRGRVNVLTWLLERAAHALPTLEVTAGDRERIDTLMVAATRLAEVSRQRFDAQAPAMRPLLEGIQRLKASLPEAAPPPRPAPPPATPVARAEPAPAVEKPPAPAAPPTPPPAPAVAPAMPAAPAAPLASADAAVDYLRQMGNSLASAAGVLRRANPSEPMAYRLLRAGLYLHLTQPPPADANGRTSVPAPPASLRSQLERMSANARWAEVLEESESALTQHRFCLDLHFHGARALAELGASFRPARQALLCELSALLRRMPTWVELVHADGTPFAGTQTKAWLESEGVPPARPAVSMPAVPAGPAPRSTGPGGLSEAMTEARALLGNGNAPAAISLLQARVGTAPDGRGRFQARLAVARLCAAAGQTAVARALYDALDREAVAHGLDAWEPALVAECLEGVLSCTRPAPKSPESLAAEYSARYHRLCLIDPSAALRVSL